MNNAFADSTGFFANSVQIMHVVFNFKQAVRCRLNMDDAHHIHNFCLLRMLDVAYCFTTE